MVCCYVVLQTNTGEWKGTSHPSTETFQIICLSRLHLNHKQWAILCMLQSHKIYGKYRINSDTSHRAEEMPDSSLGLWLNDEDVADVPLLGMKILQYAKRIIPALLLLLIP